MKRLILMMPLIASGCADFAFNSNLDKENFDEYFKPGSVRIYEQSELADLNYLYLGTVEGNPARAMPIRRCPMPVKPAPWPAAAWRTWGQRRQLRQVRRVQRRARLPEAGDLLRSGAESGRREVSPAMAIAIVRLGSPASRMRGFCIGTVRRPSRRAQSGVRQPGLVRRLVPQSGPQRRDHETRSGCRHPARWTAFCKQYKAEMAAPAAKHDLAPRPLPHHPFLGGCYCEQESRCHRSVLRPLLAEAGAVLR